LQQPRPIRFIGRWTRNRWPRSELGDGGARSLIETGSYTLVDDTVEKEPVVAMEVSRYKREAGVELQLT